MSQLAPRLRLMSSHQPRQQFVTLDPILVIDYIILVSWPGKSRKYSAGTFYPERAVLTCYLLSLSNYVIVNVATAAYGNVMPIATPVLYRSSLATPEDLY